MDDEIGDLVTVCQSIVLSVFILFLLNSEEVTSFQNSTFIGGMGYAAMKYGGMEYAGMEHAGMEYINIFH